jgi:cell fate regulator YaaT (PSP1 superfamily)
LMCCLKYENEEYETAKEQLPDLGEYVETPHGLGKVIGLNILERLLQVELSEHGRVVEYTLDELMKDGTLSIRAAD